MIRFNTGLKYYMKCRGKIKIVLPIIILLLLVIVGGGVYVKFFMPLPSPSPTPEASPTPEYDPRVITVGIDSRPIGMLFYALDYYLPRNDFQLKPVFIGDAGERWMLMSVGNLDMAISTSPEAVLGFARHNPGSMVADLSTSRGCDALLVRDNIKDIKGLMGKKIAVVPGSGDHFLLIKALNSQGMATAETLLIPSADTRSALEYFTQGDLVSACLIHKPYINDEILKDNKNKILIDTSGIYGDWTISEVLTASNYCLKERPADVQKVVNAYFELVDFIDKNPGLAKSLISKKSGRTIQEVESLLQSVRLKTLEESRAPRKEDVIKNMQNIQQIWDIEGLPNARGNIDFNRAVNYEFMENATVKGASPLMDGNPVVEPLPEFTPTPEGSPSPDSTASVSPSPHETPNEIP